MPWITPDGPIPTATVTRTITIPDGILWVGAVNGAIYELTLPANFQPIGDLTPEQVADRFRQMFEEFLAS